MRANIFMLLTVLNAVGYNTVAVDHFLEEPAVETKKKKKKGEVRTKQDYFPAPTEINNTNLPDNKCICSYPSLKALTTPDCLYFCKGDGSINILQRITFEFTDSSVAHKMNQSDNLKKYDLIAVIPKTASAFQYACGSMDVDIITFRPESKLPFKVSRKLYRQAVDRGIFFELMYSPAIRDSTSRKNIINIAHMYHSIGKSKSILVTSSAESHMHLRGVYDVINLGLLLGLNENQCRDVLTQNARNVILKAEGRRCGKSFLYITSVADSTPTPDEEEQQAKRRKLETVVST